MAPTLILPFLVSSALSFSPPPPHNQLQLEVQRARELRQTGVAAGGALVAAAASVAVVSGLVEPPVILCPSIAAVAAFLVNTASYNENRPPLPDSRFEVKESNIPGAGKGLFSLSFITKDTYIFKYSGEILTEAEYFERYPDGQGRYVAEIPGLPFPWFGKDSEPIYIDGADPTKSGLARYMNSRGQDQGANVQWKKQRFGPKAGSMYFYASRDVRAGEELCFDYGSQYWDAVVHEQ